MAERRAPSGKLAAEKPRLLEGAEDLVATYNGARNATYSWGTLHKAT